MFSVVIPLYNKELSIYDTVLSVLEQNFADFEILIINDGSTDGSLEALGQHSDPRIRIINQKNEGVSSARNTGVKEAKYEWITFLDADDFWKKNHLESLKDMIVRFPSDSVFTTSFIRSNEKETITVRNSVYIIDNYFKEALNNVVTWTSVICINRNVFEQSGFFDNKINRGEDLDMWARIGRNYRYIKSDLVTAVYNLDLGNHLSSGRSVYNNSILSKIDLKGLKSDERKYFKRMIFWRLKKNIKSLSIIESLTIVRKHNVELFL